MTLPGRSKQSHFASSRWNEDLGEAARVGGTVRIACRQEDHSALRQVAHRIGVVERCDVVVDTATTPRLVAVTFTRRGAGP